MTENNNQSADDLDRIAQAVPSPAQRKEDEKKAYFEFEELFSKTPTRNKWDLIDKYTPGKYKQPERPFSRPLPEEPGIDYKRDVREKLKMMLPRNFCPDCGQTDRPHTGGAINVNFCDQDSPDLGLKAFEIYITIFCQDCVENAVLAQKNKDDGSKIIVDAATGLTLKDKLAMERSVRIKNNTHEFIKAKLAAGDHSIYVSGKRED